jgi:hypothetical protein
MVFGDAFIYSNCLQHAYSSLRRLSPGSMILFGRHSRAGGRPAFSLDTCLVIDRVEELRPRPFDDQTYGADLLTDSVLSPIHTEGATNPLSVYFGSSRTADAGPFSFFPARLADHDPLFARPQLNPTGLLEGVISPENMQGINTASVNVDERNAIWTEVAEQVARNGCGLGYEAAPPPLVDQATAEATARQPPAPLSR